MISFLCAMQISPQSRLLPPVGTLYLAGARLLLTPGLPHKLTCLHTQYIRRWAIPYSGLFLVGS